MRVKEEQQEAKPRRSQRAPDRFQDEQPPKRIKIEPEPEEEPDDSRSSSIKMEAEPAEEPDATRISSIKMEAEPEEEPDESRSSSLLLPPLIPVRLPSKETPTDHPLFTKKAFLERQIFHVNPRIQTSETPHRNRGFGPFVAASGASPGFPLVTPRYLALRAQGHSDQETKTTLIHQEKLSPTDTRQVSMWQTQVQIGDFILLRHEYPNCPLMPPRLRDQDGQYIGPVYVLGVVTQPPMLHQPGIQERLRMENMTDEEQAGVVAFCRVEYLRMGKKRDLLASTQKCMNQVQQPTLANICQLGRTWSKSGTDDQQVRRDLWEKASITISATEFE